MTPTPLALAAADLIDTARTVLAKRGWCQHAEEDDQGRVCIIGALDYAEAVYIPPLELPVTGDEVINVAVFAVNYQVRHRRGSDAGRGIPGYNDAPTTTQEDADATLKHAAYTLRHPDQPPGGNP